MLQATTADPARSEAFKNAVLQEFFQDIHVLLSDNYAPERFSFDGVDRSRVFDVAKHVRYLDWFTAKHQKLYEAYCRFSDEPSRALFVNLIRYRLAGHLHVRIQSSLQNFANRLPLFKERFVGTTSTLASTGMFGSLQHYDAEWDGYRYQIDTIKDSLVSTLVNNQYFFDREGVLIRPGPGDHVVDGGAFTGETSIVFSNNVGAHGKIYAFDPVQDHLEICEHNVRQSGATNVSLFEYGLSDRAVEARSVRLNEYSPGWQANGDGIPLCRLDDLVRDGRIDRIDFIKLDVEGSELAALQGALDSIRRFKPRMAISIYHKPNDYFEISEYIQSLGLGYKLYLDHYTIWDEETVLYAAA